MPVPSTVPSVPTSPSPLLGDRAGLARANLGACHLLDDVDEVETDEEPAGGGREGPVADADRVDDDDEREHEDEDGQLETVGNDGHGDAWTGQAHIGMTKGGIGVENVRAAQRARAVHIHDPTRHGRGVCSVEKRRM